MKRTVIPLLVSLVGVTAFAKPPVERVVQGKERSPVERELYIPEAPPVAETVPGFPNRSPKSDGVWTAAFRAVFGPLGVVPLSPRIVW